MSVDWQRAEKNLVCLLQSLIGTRTAVELRNEAEALGVITFVDYAMNTTLEDVEYTKTNGEVEHLPNMYIQGRNIRYVVIPDDKDPMALIHDHMHRTRNAGSTYQRQMLPGREGRARGRGRGSRGRVRDPSKGGMGRGEDIQ